MTDTEIIAMQTKRILEQEADLAMYKQRCDAIRMKLICVGAPLNGNFLQYSKEQLNPFFRIQDILDGCTD